MNREVYFSFFTTLEYDSISKELYGRLGFSSSFLLSAPAQLSTTDRIELVQASISKAWVVLT